MRIMVEQTSPRVIAKVVDAPAMSGTPAQQAAAAGFREALLIKLVEYAAATRRNLTAAQIEDGFAASCAKLAAVTNANIWLDARRGYNGTTDEAVAIVGRLIGLV